MADLGDVIELTVDLPQRHLRAGTQGAIVHCHADGAFEVDIETTNPDALVECVAFDPDGPARFSALLNSFAGLQEDAGEDGVAEDVNVTNVTTAQFLLASLRSSWATARAMAST